MAKTWIAALIAYDAISGIWALVWVVKGAAGWCPGYTVAALWVL